MSLVVSLSGFIGLVPAGIGIREIAVGLSAGYMNYSFDYGIIATSFDRILATIWFSIFGFIYFHVLHLKMQHKENKIICESS
jgi:uncharacterized membrane protein YbhN (UPF0104 family)